jgi:serine/threonine protein kinase
MTESWTLVKAIVGHAMELPSEERAQYVRTACAAAALSNQTVLKETLEQEVNSLLVHAPMSVEKTEWTMFGHTAPDSALVWVGRQLGAYKIVRELGAGGMGHVFEAVRNDGSYRTRVAIKVLRASINSPASRKRFNDERHIVAALEHPGIARILDGGTIDGLPYFVMEFVEGIAIDTYCGNHQIGIAERFALFVAVCEAVESAHTQLVVHRDIKPLNILVTAEGKPKLLDFGIATIISKEAQHGPGTHGEKAPYTLTYVSPEQVDGLQISTATDVYALGMVLYRLLTGTLPYAAKPNEPEAWLEAVRHAVPRLPSAVIVVADDIAATRRAGLPSEKYLAHALAGDIDAILIKSLAKAPADRYATVTELRRDIERYLRGRPVRARQHSALYAVRKFVRRNRLPVTAALSAGIAIIIGIAGVIWQARIASDMEAKAQARASYIQEIAENMIFQYNEQIFALPGGQKVSQRLMADMADFLNKLSLDEDVPASVLLDLAQAYRKLARAQNSYREMSSDNADAASANWTRALSLTKKLYALPIGPVRPFAAAPINGDASTFRMAILVHYTELLLEIGNDHERLADFKAAEKIYREAMQRADEALAASPDNRAARIAKSKTLAHIAQIEAYFKTDYTRATEEVIKAQDIARNLLENDPDLVEAHELLSNQLTAQGLYQQELGNWDASKLLLGKALLHDRLLVKQARLNMLYAKTLASDLYRIASIDVFIFNNPTPDTEAMLIEAKKLLQPAIRNSVSDLQALYVSGMIDICLSQQALMRLDLPQATSSAINAAEVGKKLLATDPQSYDYIYFRTLASSQLITANTAAGEVSNPGPQYMEAMKPLESLASRDPAMLKRLANLGRQHAATLIRYGYEQPALALLDKSLLLLESNDKDGQTRQYLRVYGGIQFHRAGALSALANSSGTQDQKKLMNARLAFEAAAEAFSAASLLAPLSPSDMDMLKRSQAMRVIPSHFNGR